MKVGFIMNTREFKVSEINRILPMIREILKKEKELNNLREELENKRKSLGYFCSELEDLNSAKKVSNLDESLKQQLEIFIKKKEERSNEIDLSIKECEIKVTSLETQINLEKRIIFAIADVVAKTTKQKFLDNRNFYGIFEISELQKEYVQEYVFLLEEITGFSIYNFIVVNDLELGKEIFGKFKEYYMGNYEKFLTFLIELENNK